MAELTPMLKQYFELKKNHPDCILFFRLGDFYEMFGEDARLASKILDITLTARNKGNENEIPMCGIPHHALLNYLGKLTKADKKVAICEQVSDPALPGIVKREVVRIITPGTALDPEILETNQNNYILSITRGPKTWGISFCDLTTGEFKLNEIHDRKILQNEIFKLAPSEIIVTGGFLNTENARNILEGYYYNTYNPPAWEPPQDALKTHFKVQNLHGFGAENLEIAVSSAGNLLLYLKETQKNNLSHINKISIYNYSSQMILDADTIKNLEILNTYQDKSTKGSLLSVIDYTQTAMGARLLHKWILSPLLNEKQITKRLEAVDFFYKNQQERSEIESNLKHISDIERIIGRIGCQRATPKDLIALKHTLEKLPKIKKLIQDSRSEILLDFSNNLNNHPKVYALINESIMEEPPSLINEGGFIKEGYNAGLDELRNILTSAKSWLVKLQQEESEKTGINSLKVKFNRVFGYYIEISKTNIDKVPERYERRQTLANAERYTTPELKEYEAKILGAQEKIISIENSLFKAIILRLEDSIRDLQETANMIAHIDCFSGLAKCAILNHYCKPKISSKDKLIIEEGRHPVIEQLLGSGQYIPNNTKFDNQEHQFILLTGPNMSGKSSYIRQIALITLLAQIGSYVPAKHAEMGIVDRIFTRVGASDNLAKGQSTFMVEMQEAANIINNATEKSLIILDELGRGTSTYDGVSIAWAVSEYIHNNIKAKTIFATHYHELIEIADLMKQAQNYSIAVTEDNGEVIFLRKVAQGGINKSYGIEVARLAGLPREIITRATNILQKLEKESFKKEIGYSKGQTHLPLIQQTREHPVVAELKTLDVNNMTPMQALQMLSEVIGRIKK